MAMNNKILDMVEKLILDFRSHSWVTLNVVQTKAEKIRNACNIITRSWSGSFAGYHAQLYFRNFESPPLDEQFDTEWGGCHVIPEGWKKRENEEIKAEIERLVDNNFTMDEFETSTRQLFENAGKFRDEIVINFSVFDFSDNLQEEKELFFQIKKYVFGEKKLEEKKNEFISNHLPKSFASRDTKAIMQGMFLPSWLYYQGIAFESQSICESIIQFIKLIERFSRQLKLKATSETESASRKNMVEKHELNMFDSLHPQITIKCSELFRKKAYAESVEKGFLTVRDRLRTLTGYETGAEAFGKGKLHIKGATASHVDEDFNEGAKFLMMAIDKFRNEKVHTSDARIEDPIRAYEYLRISSLAMNLLETAEIKS